jgi:hypothetical protein
MSPRTLISAQNYRQHSDQTRWGRTGRRGPEHEDGHAEADQVHGLGEKLEDFEPFPPERMASRILGMGDVVSLVERAAEPSTKRTPASWRRRCARASSTLEDFLDHFAQ